MLEHATGIREDEEFGRWIVDTARDRQPWEIVVEPERARFARHHGIQSRTVVKGALCPEIYKSHSAAADCWPLISISERNRKPTSPGPSANPMGMIVDYSAEGTPIGIEFIAPSRVALSNVNTLLSSLGQESAFADELWPLINRASSNAAAAVR
jgi:hypothetical protein